MCFNCGNFGPNNILNAVEVVQQTSEHLRVRLCVCVCARVSVSVCVCQCVWLVQVQQTIEHLKVRLEL